jgi:hypothetical protein
LRFSPPRRRSRLTPTSSGKAAPFRSAISIDGLIAQSAALKQEVAAALTAAKKKADDIICSGNRFSNQWVNLGGLRAAPYTCEFSGKWLIIEATTRVTDKAGHAYDTITPAAMKKAVKVTETNPTWK